MKKFLSVCIAAILLLTCCFAVACNVGTTKVKVFLHHYDDLDLTEIIIYNYQRGLPTPTREGYEFDGWFWDEEGTQPFVPHTVVTHNFHLYARWTQIEGGGQEEPFPSATHTVTFVFCDGVTGNSTVTVNDGMPVPLSEPTRQGYRFDGWWTAQTGGTQWTAQKVARDITLYAHWTETAPVDPHTTHIYESYFMYTECCYEGCNVVGRASSNRNYDNMYTYTTAKGNKIASDYQNCQSALNKDVSSFVTAFETYESDLDYLDGQYYWASLYSDTRNMDYTTIANVYDEHFANYYQLFISADNKFGDDFWEAYGDDREEVLYWAQLYSGGDDFGVGDALQEYYNAMNRNSVNTNTLNYLYKNLVTAYNKEAKHYGYNNYMDYAYAMVYNREYTPSQTEKMRALVKKYIAPALAQISDKLDALNANTETNKTFYNALMSGSIVGSSPNKDAVNYIGNYFKWLTDNSNPEKPIDFYTAVNEMFRDGNYFTGSGEGAYTMWVPSDEMAAVYVQKGSEYDSAFTFVHEFGHYYENYHNGGLALSYDHDETHSQGNEMLFLAWLKQNKPANVTTGMTMVELEQLYNMLWTVCMASAVDELEVAAYTGTYQGRSVTGGYHALFSEILSTYGDAASILQQNGTYWYYVAFDNAAYYISYAMSALPSVELYTIAESDGLEKARDTYFKLFRYCEDEAHLANLGYLDVLTYCGLDNPFNETLYTHIADYVSEL